MTFRPRRAASFPAVLAASSLAWLVAAETLPPASEAGAQGPVDAPGTGSGSLESILNALGTHRVARMEEPANDDHPGWTITAASTDESTWVCLETTVAPTRCYTIAAPARGFVMPSDPARRFPVSIALGVEVAPGDFEQLVVQFASPTADPALALSNFVAGNARRTLPRVYVRDATPAELASLVGFRLIHAEAGITYAAHGGTVRACERIVDTIACTAPAEIAAPDERLEVDPDAQGPHVFELEIDRVAVAGSTRLELTHVVVFARTADGRLVHGGTVPFGGLRSVRSDDGTSTEHVEVLYEVLEAETPDCLRIGAPEVMHRIEYADGRERELPRVRLARAAGPLTTERFGADALLLDVSGRWRLGSEGRFERVTRCR